MRGHCCPPQECLRDHPGNGVDTQDWSAPSACHGAWDLSAASVSTVFSSWAFLGGGILSCVFHGFGLLHITVALPPPPCCRTTFLFEYHNCSSAQSHCPSFTFPRENPVALTWLKCLSLVQAASSSPGARDKEAGLPGQWLLPEAVARRSCQAGWLPSRKPGRVTSACAFVLRNRIFGEPDSAPAVTHPLPVFPRKGDGHAGKWNPSGYL